MLSDNPPRTANPADNRPILQTPRSEPRPSQNAARTGGASSTTLLSPPPPTRQRYLKPRTSPRKLLKENKSERPDKEELPKSSSREFKHELPPRRSSKPNAWLTKLANMLEQSIRSGEQTSEPSASLTAKPPTRSSLLNANRTCS
jgi:hypothetical protein